MISLIVEAIIVTATAWIFTKKYFNTRLNSELILVWFILFFSQIILVELFWGIIGKLYYGNVFLTQLAIFILVFLFCYDKNTFCFSKPDLNFFLNDNLLIFAFSVFSAFFLSKTFLNLINPPVYADSWQMHLAFPAAWIKSGNLDTPFQIFGSRPMLDPGALESSAGSYYPINPQLFFMWLMMPLRNAFLADVGEAPFYIIGIVAVYSILRRYNINKNIALLSGFLWALIPNIFKQLKSGSQIDIICVVLFLLVFYTLLLLKFDFTLRNTILFGISIGLFVGTKVTNLIWLAASLPFISYLLYTGLKTKKITFGKILSFLSVVSLMIILFGSFRYIKNYIFTGNPVFPVELKIFGKTIFEGLLDNISYKQQIALNVKFDLIRFIFREGLGVQFLAIILPGLFLPILFLGYLRKRVQPLGENLLLFITPLLMLVLYAYFINVHTVRYLFVFLSMGLVTSVIFITTFSRGEKYIIFIAFISILTAAFKLANGYELVVSILLSLLFFITLAVYKKQIAAFYKSKKLGKFILGVLLLEFLFLVFLNNKYDREEFDRYPLIFSKKEAWQRDIGKGWKALNELTKEGAKVAFTGRQEFYPLYGSKLKNQVKYVSVNEKEIIPYNKPDGQYRKNKDFTAWRENLKKEKIEYLFIMLPCFDNRELPDPKKFPVEDDWAIEHPEDFQLLFNNSLSRIYKVSIK